MGFARGGTVLVMNIKEKMVKRIQQSWKIQTFQYTYVSHISKKFTVVHFFFFVLAFVLMGLLRHEAFFLLQIPCILSWNYFVFFDKKRRVYCDAYKPERYEFIGTMLTSIGFGFMILLMVFKTE